MSSELVEVASPHVSTEGATSADGRAVLDWDAKIWPEAGGFARMIGRCDRLVHLGKIGCRG